MYSTQNGLFSLAIALFGVFTFPSCKTSSHNSWENDVPSPSEPEIAEIPSHPDYLYATANVESVDAAVISGHGPTQLRLRIRGLLNDGATKIDQIQQIRVPEGYVVTATTARLRSAMASLALVPFERELLIDLSDFPSGPCLVRVNGVLTTVYVP